MGSKAQESLGTCTKVKTYPEPVSVNWDILNDISQLQMSDPTLSLLYNQVEDGEGNEGSG